MKVIHEDYITEVFFTNKKNLDLHYLKHVISDDDEDMKMVYMSKEEYNNLADTLSNAQAYPINVFDANIIGYVSETGRILKYDKETNLLVVYVDDDILGHEVISLYRQPIHKFYRKLKSSNPDFKYSKDIQ